MLKSRDNSQPCEGSWTQLSQAKVVPEVLCSLAPKFDYVAIAIKEFKDISKLTLKELSGSLQAYEIRVNRSSVKVSKKALHVKVENSTSSIKEKGSCNVSTGWSVNRGCGRGFFPGRGRGRWTIG